MLGTWEGAASSLPGGGRSSVLPVGLHQYPGQGHSSALFGRGGVSSSPCGAHWHQSRGVLVTPGQWWTLQFSTRPPPTHPRGTVWGTMLLSQLSMQSPLMGLGGAGSLDTTQGWKSWLPAWPPLTPLVRVSGTSWQPREGGGPGSPLAWGWRHSLFCVWLKGSTYYLKVSVFLGCPSPGPLTSGPRFLLGFFFVCAHWHFWVAGFFNSKPGMWCKKKPREPITISSPMSQCPSQPFSPPFSLLRCRAHYQ